MTADDRSPQNLPDDLELLLPWHANGTLAPRDACRVEEALARDPALARQYAAIRQEYSDAIHLNENLGVPSSRAMQQLFTAIDAEPARAQHAKLSLATRLGHFLASLSPRTLVYAAGAAALLLVLQAGVIGAVVVKDLSGSYRTASDQPTKAISATALVRFQPDAHMAEVSTLLGSYNAVIVGGPRAGTIRIQIGDKALSRDELTKLMARLQAEEIVGFATPAD